MPKVVYTPAKGLFQQPGSGIQLQTTPYVTVQTQNTHSGSVIQPGVYTVDGAAVVGTVMPLASAVPGGVFIFRSLSNYAHYLTGSAEASGVRVFKNAVTGSETQVQGSKLTLAATAGSSVAVVSDGLSFLVLNSSGNLAFANG